MGKVIQLHFQPRDEFRQAALKFLRDISPVQLPLREKVTNINARRKHEQRPKR